MQGNKTGNRIKGIYINYEQILTQLKLYRLEEWRLRGYLIETFKLLTGKENIDPDQFFTLI